MACQGRHLLVWLAVLVLAARSGRGGREPAHESAQAGLAGRSATVPPWVYPVGALDARIAAGPHCRLHCRYRSAGAGQRSGWRGSGSSRCAMASLARSSERAARYSSISAGASAGAGGRHPAAMSPATRAGPIQTTPAISHSRPRKVTSSKESTRRSRALNSRQSITTGGSSRKTCSGRRSPCPSRSAPSAARPRGPTPAAPGPHRSRRAPRRHRPAASADPAAPRG